MTPLACIRGAEPSVDQSRCGLEGQELPRRGVYVSYALALDAEQLGDMIAQGAHPKYIQAQLGHASIQTTLDRYGHLMPQLHQAEAQKLDELVFGQQAASPARRLQAVRVGRPARESKMGAVNTKGLAT